MQQEDPWRRGLGLFNSGRFFDAHEALEDVWREAPRHGHLRRHLQGMVQLSVAFHHASTGNHIGARSVLERALRNLDGAEESFPEVDLKHLKIMIRPWRKYLASAAPNPGSSHPTVVPSPPELPKLHLGHGRRKSTC